MQTSVAFALKNLTVAIPLQNSINAKRALDKLALRGILATLKDAKDSRLVDALLRLIYVLCFDSKVIRNIVNEGALIEKHKAEFPELVLQITSKLEASKGETSQIAAEKNWEDQTAPSMSVSRQVSQSRLPVLKGVLKSKG